MHIVLDNNVTISALLIQYSIPYQVYQKVSEEHTLLISEAIILELITRLKREKFSKYFVSPLIRDELILAYLKTCRNVKVTYQVDICRDPDDNKYLELAMSSKADLIISGDKDLLVLDPFEQTKIVNPAEFLRNFG